MKRSLENSHRLREPDHAARGGESRNLDLCHSSVYQHCVVLSSLLLLSHFRPISCRGRTETIECVTKSGEEEREMGGRWRFGISSKDDPPRSPPLLSADFDVQSKMNISILTSLIHHVELRRSIDTK